MILLSDIPGRKATEDILVVNIDVSFSVLLFLPQQASAASKSFPPQDSARGRVNLEMSTVLPVTTGDITIFYRNL